MPAPAWGPGRPFRRKIRTPSNRRALLSNHQRRPAVANSHPLQRPPSRAVPHGYGGSEATPPPHRPPHSRRRAGPASLRRARSALTRKLRARALWHLAPVPSAASAGISLPPMSPAPRSPLRRSRPPAGALGGALERTTPPKVLVSHCRTSRRPRARPKSRPFRRPEHGHAWPRESLWGNHNGPLHQ